MNTFEFKSCLYIIGIGMPFLFTYLITIIHSSKAIRSWRQEKKPPMAPYWIPFLGHGLSFLYDTGVVGQLQRNSTSEIIGLKLGKNRVNFVSGADTIAKLWRSKDLDATAVTSFSLKEFFATPAQSMRVYLGDNSGVGPQPHPRSDITEKNRYYYQNRKAIVGFFNGPGLKSMGNRFTELLAAEIHKLDIPQVWTRRDDLYEFIQQLVIGPAVEAMCGPVLLDRNPDFGKCFWQMDHDILYFFKSYPRWLVPGAYRNRAKLLQDVKDWHTFAEEQFDDSYIEEDGHDQFYGSPLMRTRQQYLKAVDNLDADAIASQDLGLLWAENANSIPAIFWMVYETLRRPRLFSRALNEIMSSQSWEVLESDPKLNIESLCTMPTFQSMYAETLRLYTSLFALRSAAHGDLDIVNFTIPQDELIAVDSRVCAMDSATWNAGRTEKDMGAQHPLEEFWADRFLVYDDNPNSGPLRNRISNGKAPSANFPPTPDGDTGPRFSMDGLAGAWTPFGGGNRACPGRNFAKQEIIIGFTLIFSMLDIELIALDKTGTCKPDLKYYGLGTLPPKGKVPFRIRRRI